LVSEALAMCREAMGQVFTGYKGGDYVMGALTPLWIANWGSGGGMKILSIDTETGHIETAWDGDDDA
jgi:hypothetical protein